MDKIEITVDEYNILKEKAAKWDSYTAKLTKNLKNSQLTHEERSARAKKAIEARWNKRRENGSNPQN